MNTNKSYNQVSLIEEWRDIPGYEGLYQVSNFGKVYSVKRYERGRMFGGYEMKARTRHGRPYLWVNLSKNGKSTAFLVHRLVAMVFIGDYQEDHVVNHIDENPLNNRADNLEWCTQKYNCNYGTRIERIKANMPQNKAVYQTTMNGDVISEFPTIQEAARQTGICAGHICDVCKGNREFASGYKWRYVDAELFALAQKSLNEKIKASKDSRKRKFIEKSRNVAQYDQDGNLLKVWQGMREIMEELGFVRPSIINCCNGKIKTAYGYVWRYA